MYCSVSENIHTPPTEGIGVSWGVGGSVRPKNLRECVVLKKPFRGADMDIFWNYTLLADLFLHNFIGYFMSHWLFYFICQGLLNMLL